MAINSRKKKIVVGNWKMNVETAAGAKKIVQTVKRKTSKVGKTDVVFCVPSIYLSTVAPMMKGKYLLGAQNVFYEDVGSYTGEISPVQLKRIGVSHVLIGHSERRIKISGGETDEVVAKKVQAVLRNKMKPVLCVGEQSRDENGDYLAFVKNQLALDLKFVSKAEINDVVIAYEPVSFIGAKEAMNASHIHEMIIYIRKCLLDMFGEYASKALVIYGASSSPENAKDIIENGAAEGLLPGRDSLDPERFSQMVMIVDGIK